MWNLVGEVRISENMSSFDIPSIRDISLMAPGEVDALLRRFDAMRRHAEVAVATVVQRVEAASVHQTDGHRRVSHWCRAAANWSSREATGMVRLGRLLELWPSLELQGLAGRVGVSQLRVLQQLSANPRVAEHLPGAEETLVRAAVELDFDDFVDVVARWESLADPDGSEVSADEAHARRRARLVEVGQTWYLDAAGGAAQSLAMNEVFEEFCRTEWLADWEAGVAEYGEAEMCGSRMVRTEQQRKYDALHAIFLAAASASTTGDGPTVTLNLVMGAERFVHTLTRMLGGDPEPIDPNDPDHRSETLDGELVDPRDAVMAAMHGQVRRVLVDQAGVVVDVGRRQRFFTGPLRDAVLMHHRRCIWPGCQVPASACQADHVIPWANAGPTASRNGGPGCPHHNRWRTHGYTTVRDEFGHWHHYRPDGSEVGWRAAA